MPIWLFLGHIFYLDFFPNFFPNSAFEPYLLDQGPLNQNWLVTFKHDWISQWLELLKRKDEEESSMPIWLFLGHIFYLDFFSKLLPQLGFRTLSF